MKKTKKQSTSQMLNAGLQASWPAFNGVDRKKLADRKAQNIADQSVKPGYAPPNRGKTDDIPPGVTYSRNPNAR